MRILTCLIGRVHMRSRVVNKLNADAKNGRVRDSSRCCRWDATRNLSAIGILQGEKDVARQIFWLLTSNCGENLLKYGWLLCVCTPVMNMLNRPNTTCVCVCVCVVVCVVFIKETPVFRVCVSKRAAAACIAPCRVVCALIFASDLLRAARRHLTAQYVDMCIFMWPRGKSSNFTFSSADRLPSRADTRTPLHKHIFK